MRGEHPTQLSAYPRANLIENHQGESHIYHLRYDTTPISAERNGNPDPRTRIRHRVCDARGFKRNIPGVPIGDSRKTTPGVSSILLKTKQKKMMHTASIGTFSGFPQGTPGKQSRVFVHLDIKKKENAPFPTSRGQRVTLQGGGGGCTYYRA